VRAICHLGASPGVPASLKHPREYFQNNVVGTVTLLDVARRREGRAVSVRPRRHRVCRGAAAPFARTPAGHTGEPYCASNGGGNRRADLPPAFGVPFVSLRFFNVYGRLRPELALAVSRGHFGGNPLPLYGTALSSAISRTSVTFAAES